MTTISVILLMYLTHVLFLSFIDVLQYTGNNLCTYFVGILVYLCHPYPRQVSEPIEYEEPVFSEGLDVLGVNKESIPSCLSVRNDHDVENGLD